MYFEPMPNGLYSEELVKASGLPVFESLGDENYYSDYYTYTDLKEIFQIELSEVQRRTEIKAFITNPRMIGYAALYSLVGLANDKYGTNYTFTPPGN